MTGLHVLVLRPAGRQTDCTNGGVTARFDAFTLTGDGVEGPFEPDATAPELRLVRRQLQGRHGPMTYLHAVPVYGPDGTPPLSDARVTPGAPGAPVHGGMFGGNFISTSDSRFPNDYPIAVHDRFEDYRR